MTDTNQLPQSEREAFEAFAQNCPMGQYSIARRGDGYDSSHTQLMWDAWQARAQVQGEAFGYIHHFAAHDESGALIDTTWEADGCADPLPHPTLPSMWKWTHCTPFYTTPQPAQATQAEVTDDIRPEDFTVDVVVKPMGGFAPVNTQGVRVTHKPTGISVTCDAARSQHANRNQAFEKLSAILALRPERVPMTDDEIDAVQQSWIRHQYDLGSQKGPRGFARAIEAHHGITAQAKKETP